MKNEDSKCLEDGRASGAEGRRLLFGSSLPIPALQQSPSQLTGGYLVTKTACSDAENSKLRIAEIHWYASC